MTKMKLISLCVLLATLLCPSCTRQERPGGAVSIRFSAGLPETRALTDAGSEIVISAGVPDLVILIFNGNGSLAAKYPGNGVLQDGAAANDMTVRFSGLAAGTYSVYAVGNATGLWATKVGNNSVSLGDVTTQAQADALYFTPLFTAETDPKPNPALQNGRLPVSAKGSLTVSENGNGEVNLPLLRCTSLVTVEFIDLYGEDLTLENFTFQLKGINASTGYLFPHTPSDIPDSVVYGDWGASAGAVNITYDGTDTGSYALEALFFPSDAPQYYLCDIAFDITDSHAQTFPFSWQDLTVLNKQGRGITGLGRNQHLRIAIRISKGTMVSFNFEVADWDTTDSTQTVHFD